MVGLSKKLFQLAKLGEIVAELDPAFYHNPASPLKWTKV